MVESINSQYINILICRPLMRISFLLRSPKRGLISIKNNDQKYSPWCHIRHINPVKIHSKRITRKDKKLVNDLHYSKIKFSVSEEEFNKIETKSNICIKVFCYENKLIFPVHISDQKFENSMNVLLIIN